MGKLQSLREGEQGASLRAQNDSSMICFLNAAGCCELSPGLGCGWGPSQRSPVQGSSLRSHILTPWGGSPVPLLAFLYLQHTFPKYSLLLFPGNQGTIPLLQSRMTLLKCSLCSHTPYWFMHSTGGVVLVYHFLNQNWCWIFAIYLYLKN